MSGAYGVGGGVAVPCWGAVLPHRDFNSPCSYSICIIHCSYVSMPFVRARLAIGCTRKPQFCVGVG